MVLTTGVLEIIVSRSIGRLIMARTRNGEAIGPAGKTRAARTKLQRFINEAQKKSKLGEWRRGRAVQGYIGGKKVTALSEELGSRVAQ